MSDYTKLKEAAYKLVEHLTHYCVCYPQGSGKCSHCDVVREFNDSVNQASETEILDCLDSQVLLKPKI